MAQGDGARKHREHRKHRKHNKRRHHLAWLLVLLEEKAQ